LYGTTATPYDSSVDPYTTQNLNIDGTNKAEDMVHPFHDEDKELEETI
jgi:hypothetical protein